MMTEEKECIQCKVSVDEDVLRTAISNVANSASSSLELVGSIDQGTSSSRFLVFTREGRIAASAQVEHRQIFPSGEDRVGWHEHDPLEIWSQTKRCIDAVRDALLKVDTDGLELAQHIKALGITNQRETTVAWNDRTGAPYHHAIVWDDLRTTKIASEIAAACSEQSTESTVAPVDSLRSQTGLPLASYFAGTKVRWLIDNVPELRRDLEDVDGERKHVRFGTIDSWLVYQLTGTAVTLTASSSSSESPLNTGGLFLTDVTNASRWLLMDLHTLQWDPKLMETVCGVTLPSTALPEIRPSSQIYGTCSTSPSHPALLQNVPICAILGDQQAALFGQSAFEKGQAKCTYGTGLFLMMNTAGSLVHSTQGLLTTVAYQLGYEPPVYALEGSVSHSGSVIQWLRDQLQIIDSASESETLAAAVATNEGLYFVPAFAGLFAPYWRSDARGCLVGLTASHTKHHVCRAALEATAYQAKELFDAMALDSEGGARLTSLKVDGGATANKLLLQFQADMIDAEVVVPEVMETTAIGAAFAAGLAVGVWQDLDEIKTMWAVSKVWTPTMEDKKRRKYWRGWKRAVVKSFDSVDVDDNEDEEL